MDYLSTALLGIIQGLTEFLPVSSSGHLAIGQAFLDLKENTLILDIALHFGTLLSVLTVYWRPIKKILGAVFKKFGKKTPELRYIGLVIVGCVPVGIVGTLFKSWFESLFHNLNIVGFCLLVTGFVLFFTKCKSDSAVSLDLEVADHAKDITYKQALLIGLAQAFAIFPGISRSGSTIACGLYVGLNRSQAASFSFFLAIPVILGALLLQIRDVPGSLDLAPLLFGVLISYLAGLAGLLGVLYFLKKGRLHVFSPYLWLVGIALLVLS